VVHEHDKGRAREKRHARVRSRMSGNEARLRLCVFRSLGHLYVQAFAYRVIAFAVGGKTDGFSLQFEGVGQ